jgi:outer membrane beta-barrel protein
MMRRSDLALLLAAAALLIALPFMAVAQPAAQAPGSGAQQPANQQVVVPQVDRRDIRVPKFPSKDISIGLFGGAHATQNFGTSGVGGLRLGYHVTEDIFVDAVYAQTKVSDEQFRQILPGGIFTSPDQTLKYYNVSAGYNLFPGEIFLGRSYAFPTQFYVIGGVGSTRFLEQRRQTFNFGFGWRVLFWDRFAVQLDLRDHIYSLDILGKRQNTKNLETTLGATFYF